MKYASECSRFTNRKPYPEVLKQFDEVIKRKSQKAKEQCGSYERFRYGERERQYMDVFYPQSYSPDTEIVVFFHGGYWETGSSEENWFIAVPIVKSGKICIVMSRMLFPTVAIKEVATQDHKAMGFIAKQFSDAAGVTIAGHSSGGFECAALLSTSWKQVDENVENYFKTKLKRAVLMCGVFDVTQLLDTVENDIIKLSWQEAVDLSPVAYVEQLSANMKEYKCDIYVVDSENDCPSIKRASNIYMRELDRLKVPFTSVLIKNDHFTMIEELDETENECMKIILCKELKRGDNKG